MKVLILSSKCYSGKINLMDVPDKNYGCSSQGRHIPKVDIHPSNLFILDRNVLDSSALYQALAN